MKQFGKYHLQAKIGAGGMAEVYLGRSFGAEGLEKQVVIKRIRPEFAQKARFVSMFIGEAKIAVSLNHPNVVQVYEFGCIDEDYYLAMEYVEGTDLARLQGAADALSRPFPVADAIYVAIEIAKGLDYAHRKKDPFGRPLNIVHRDISPQNILISREGGVKLLDFGIAKAAGVGEHESEIKGKYSYMSPEQARGEVVDARSDIFSLGIVLWETLAGESLFPYTSAKETLEQVRSGTTRDILDARDDIDESLAVILRKALEPYPEDRFETARDFQIALTRSLFATGTVADTFTLANFAGEVGGALTPDPLAMTSSSGRTQAPSSLTGAPNTGSAGVIDRLVGDTGGDLSGAPFETSPEQGRSTAITQPPGSHTEHGVEPPVHIQIERKDMVLLVGEVRGLEELRGASGYERWQQVLMDYIRMVEAIAFKNDAVIDRLGEQGFAIALGLPVSAENDAERAVRMALALVEAIEAMNINLAAPLQLAIGAVVGYAVLEQEIQKGSKTLHGHKFEWAFDEEESGRGGLYLAEALARSGMSREILLGGRILRRVQRHYQTEAIQKVTIDLDDDTVELSAHKLVGPKSGREQVKEVRHAYQKLFGRDLALKNLRETYRRVLLRSRVQALLITGEQGVGKSTLVNEFLAGLSSGGSRPRQVTLIRGVAELHDKETPFGSLRSLLMELLRLPRGADLRLAQARLTTLTDALLAGESEIDRKFVVHALTFLLGIKIVGNVIEDLSTASRREVLTRSLQQFIVALATHKPLLMALEDMHNVDQATLGFLSNALSSSIEAPIFILMTSLLPDEAQPGWSELLGQSGLRVEKLGELDARGARELAEAMLPEALETEEVALAVVSRAGGNPLFIKELVELIAERGLTDPREIAAQLESNDEGSWIPTTVEA